MLQPKADPPRAEICVYRMVNEKKIFIVAGTDFLQRQRAIESIKKRILKDAPSLLSIFTLYSKEINPDQLRKNIFTLSFNKEKIVIFKNALKLSSPVKSFLFKEIKRIISNNYIVLEIEKDYYQFQKENDRENFFRFAINQAAIFKVPSRTQDVSFEDFIKSIYRNDLGSSLYIMEKLFTGKNKDTGLGVKILGVLISKFSRINIPLKRQVYFRYLWEADRSMKEKGINPRLTLETLLVRLFSA